METFKTLLILSFALFSYVHGACYTSGVSWGNNQERTALNASLPLICRQLTGNFPAGSSSTRCIKGGGAGNKYDFSWRNISPKPQSLTMKVCMSAVMKDVKSCPRGAYNQNSIWWWTSVPPSYYPVLPDLTCLSIHLFLRF
ncbi:hypothetical protein CROQUDRAFT_48065 [Cronartium quercuum f. sp. fusiforme G11]|uniref:Secreted protein n=1 Tax=Cronartium quercuum f. sp. fusiforme G11 TaxID=708437 RepID=A0A9P6TAU6_9BASI|nr:hypothetical protein CROQUDRAFT_48065 [Cronartium quercuum f. sp. fusiforme G11]